MRFLGSLEAKLSDGDSVTVLPAVAGGAFGFAALAAISQHSAALAALSQQRVTGVTLSQQLVTSTTRG